MGFVKRWPRVTAENLSRAGVAKAENDSPFNDALRNAVAHHPVSELREDTTACNLPILSELFRI
jgi:hypothetical protein